jgi:hypothetical protein
MWQGRAIGLIPSRFVAVVGLGRAPASARGGDRREHPRRLAVPVRPAAMQANVLRPPLDTTRGLGVLGWRRARAGKRLHRRRRQWREEELGGAREGRKGRLL